MFAGTIFARNLLRKYWTSKNLELILLKSTIISIWQSPKYVSGHPNKKDHSLRYKNFMTPKMCKDEVIIIVIIINISIWYISISSVNSPPANIYYRSTRKRSEICATLAIKTRSMVNVFLLLTWKIFQTFF